jgi:hypothetical protein
MGNGCVGACCRCTYVRYWVLPYYLIPYLDSTYLTYIYIYIYKHTYGYCVYIHQSIGMMATLLALDPSLASVACLTTLSIHLMYCTYVSRHPSRLCTRPSPHTAFLLRVAGQAWDAPGSGTSYWQVLRWLVPCLPWHMSTGWWW